MKIPVLLIVFNRLSTTKEVFKQIRLYKPSQLFIGADGPRVGKNENVKCDEVRNWVLDNIDWNCEVETLFEEINLGCGKFPSQAISWFFREVNEGVILEDDTVPHIDFFDFSRLLLEKYRNNEEIMAVNSSNFQEVTRSDGSYYFSMQNGPFCAWATWKRSWDLFDYDLNHPSIKQVNSSLRFYRTLKRERQWWLNIYKGVKENRYDGSSWDYQFIFSIWGAKGKSIVPNVNLSTNIGFGPGATHTINPDSPTANRVSKAILPIKFPSKENISREADLFYHDFYYDKFVEHISLFKMIKRFIKKVI